MLDLTRRRFLIGLGTAPLIIGAGKAGLLIPRKRFDLGCRWVRSSYTFGDEGAGQFSLQGSSDGVTWYDFPHSVREEAGAWIVTAL